jgi:beta-galactosidase beta subunit
LFSIKQTNNNNFTLIFFYTLFGEKNLLKISLFTDCGIGWSGSILKLETPNVLKIFNQRLEMNIYTNPRWETLTRTLCEMHTEYLRVHFWISGNSLEMNVSDFPENKHKYAWPYVQHYVLLEIGRKNLVINNNKHFSKTIFFKSSLKNLMLAIGTIRKKSKLLIC